MLATHVSAMRGGVVDDQHANKSWGRVFGICDVAIAIWLNTSFSLALQPLNTFMPQGATCIDSIATFRRLLIAATVGFMDYKSVAGLTVDAPELNARGVKAWRRNDDQAIGSSLYWEQSYWLDTFFVAQHDEFRKNQRRRGHLELIGELWDMSDKYVFGCKQEFVTSLCPLHS